MNYLLGEYNNEIIGSHQLIMQHSTSFVFAFEMNWVYFKEKQQLVLHRFETFWHDIQRQVQCKHIDSDHSIIV